MQSTIDPYMAVRAELAALRHQVPGVQGCVIAGVDGLLILHDTPQGAAEPHDIAALAAGAHGISRTCGAALHQGSFHECTIRNQRGYLVIYAVGDLALVAVLGDDRLNIARLHIEARQATARVAALMQIEIAADAHPFDRR